MMATTTSLRVAVFGIPRSGKDYNINRVIESLNTLGLDFVHYPGVPTVRSYSLPLLGKEFTDTTIEEKGRLMDVFRRKISNRKEHPFLIQDEHYCFPTLYGGKPLVNEYTMAKFPYELKRCAECSGEYEVVLKEEWICDCNAVFYLRPDADTIRDRMQNSNGVKQNAQITADDISSWIEFEINALLDICTKQCLCFEVLDANDGAYESIIRFVCGVVGASTENSNNEEYRIIGGTENGIDGEYDEWRMLDLYKGENLIRTRFSWLDYDLRTLDLLCYRKDNTFDLDLMTETDRTVYFNTFKVVKDEASRSMRKNIDLSAHSFINERILGDSLNSIPTPNQMKNMFRLSPVAGLICLGKSMKILVEELNSEYFGLEYNSYSDLLMKLKENKHLRNKEYDLILNLENHRRHYATNIRVKAPDPLMIDKWKKLIFKLVRHTFDTGHKKC